MHSTRWESELMRLLQWEDCLNVRDVGGYPTQDGRQTRLGALVRADSLYRLTGAGRAALLDYGVRTIVDLRFREEIERQPNPFAQPVVGNGNITYLNLPAVAGTDTDFEAAMNGAQSMQARYCLALDYGRERTAKISTAIAEAPEGGVLVHCHVGRDRTGRLVAVLLALVGVRRETIAEDYALSDVYLQPLYDELMKSEADPGARQALARQIAEAPAMMLNVLSYLETKYGGAEGYLQEGGMAKGNLERLKSRLVEK
jgi:protein-tyrosine phosphatase